MILFLYNKQKDVYVSVDTTFFSTNIYKKNILFSLGREIYKQNVNFSIVNFYRKRAGYRMLAVIKELQKQCAGGACFSEVNSSVRDNAPTQGGIWQSIK